jgi:hypothetical protein
VFDCPGQIELYSHVDVFRHVVRFLRREGWSPLVVYCLDSHFMTDAAKFIAGSLQALSAMVKLELPHINVLTKMDLLQDKVGRRARRRAGCCCCCCWCCCCSQAWLWAAVRAYTHGTVLPCLPSPR